MAEKRKMTRQSSDALPDEGLDGFDVIDLDGFEVYDFESNRRPVRSRSPEDRYEEPQRHRSGDRHEEPGRRRSRERYEEPRRHRSEDRHEEPGRRRKRDRYEEPAKRRSRDRYENDSRKLTLGKVIGRTLAVLLVTLLMILVFLVGVLALVFKGPSTEARRLMTLSCHETSAMKWVPTLFISLDEYNEILNPVKEEEKPLEKPSKEAFVPLPMVDGAEDPEAQGGGDVVFGEVDESLPELEVIDINGGTFKGKMMIVRNPARVKIAAIDHFGGAGWTLSQFLEKYDAIGCTNAGGFEDENGKGKGGIPDGLVIQNGEIVYGSAGSHYVDVVGFDADHVLHVGNMSGQDALNAGIVDGASFQTGPVLIKNGERQTGFVSGINPRTCIGQTADGTVLLIAVEGRMADSLGATFEDMTDILEEYGAINAGNFDGGSSSGMYYEGERITRSCSVIGDRPLPTAVIVTR